MHQSLDEILCVLPKDLRRSLACTNIIENMNGTIRQVTRNVKRWRDASMALRWTTAGMIEAKNPSGKSIRAPYVAGRQQLLALAACRTGIFSQAFR
jgi:transposase-like protein